MRKHSTVRTNLSMIIGVIFISVVCLVMVSFAGHLADSSVTRQSEKFIYYTPCVVVEVEETITVQTKDGSLWKFKGNDFYVGNTVLATFDNNGTPNTIDDVIVNVRSY